MNPERSIALILLTVGSLISWRLWNKAGADIRAANAQERIADAMENVARENAEKIQLPSYSSKQIKRMTPTQIGNLVLNSDTGEACISYSTMTFTCERFR